MKRWEIINKLSASNSNYKDDELIDVLLENRGIKTKKEKADYLNPHLDYLNFDNVGIDEKAVKKTIARIKSAIAKQEQIIIYGDYDVDGLTAAAILWETLYALKANVTPYIPHRIEEGYGLSQKGIDNVITKFPKTKLIITVDNGIVAMDAVDYANTKHIDVIITDHHVQGEKLPEAFTIVHTTNLCGAGIAYLLSQEIKKNLSQNIDPHQPDDILELAALGTIADLVPLHNANRIIVKFGLQKLQSTKRLGLLALFEESGINKDDIGVYEVEHIIAPRLNATGRMDTAMDSLRLLCTKDLNRAKLLAALLGSTNKERQMVMLDAVKHASLSVHTRTELKKLLIVTHETYPEGVIGLVAGRLVEEFYRPAIVISKGEKLSKGSVRSIKGFNIIEFLRNSTQYFVNIGGHPMAAGFTIETDRIASATKILEDLANTFIKDELFTRTILIDCELQISSINYGLYTAIQRLGPFGMGNPEPTFVSYGAEITNIKLLGKDGKHLKLNITDDKSKINFEVIAFGFAQHAGNLQIGDKIDLVYTVDENTWLSKRSSGTALNDNKILQLKVKDLRKSEAIARAVEVE